MGDEKKKKKENDGEVSGPPKNPSSAERSVWWGGTEIVTIEDIMDL